jgi:hypothetical protein
MGCADYGQPDDSQMVIIFPSIQQRRPAGILPSGPFSL